MSVEVEDDDRDTEDEIADLYGALEDLAGLFGDEVAAVDLGPRFTCGEADTIAKVLIVGNQRDPAITLLEAHAVGDAGGDTHGKDDFEGYEYAVEHLGLRRTAEPLVEEAEPPRPDSKPVSTEELLQLLGL